MLLFSLAIEPGSRNLNWSSRRPPFLPFSITSLISHLHWFPSSPSPFSFEPPWLSPWSSLLTYPCFVGDPYSLNVFEYYLYADNAERCYCQSRLHSQMQTQVPLPTQHLHMDIAGLLKFSVSETQAWIFPPLPALSIAFSISDNGLQQKSGSHSWHFYHLPHPIY